MQFHVLAAGMMAIGLCAPLRAADYILDVTRIDATYPRQPVKNEKPKSLTSRSVEIGVVVGTEFYTCLRSGNRRITIKGRVFTEKPGKLMLKISIQDVSETSVKRTEERGNRSCSTQVGVDLQKPVAVAGLISMDKEITHSLFAVCLERTPANQARNGTRRRRLALQYRSLLRQIVNSSIKQR